MFSVLLTCIGCHSVHSTFVWLCVQCSPDLHRLPLCPQYICMIMCSVFSWPAQAATLSTVHLFDYVFSVLLTCIGCHSVHSTFVWLCVQCSPDLHRLPLCPQYICMIICLGFCILQWRYASRSQNFLLYTRSRTGNVMHTRNSDYPFVWVWLLMAYCSNVYVIWLGWTL